MKTCPNCNKTNIPNEAQFCPDCGMWLSHEGLITTLANDPEGYYHHSGVYCPTKRERMALDHMKEEDNKISNNLWRKYNQIVYLHNKANTSQGEISWVSYNTENVHRVILSLRRKLKEQCGVYGDWIVNEYMFGEYKKSHSLLLRVGSEIYSILIVYRIEGVDVVHCENRLWQEVECQKDGYIPCLLYIELSKVEDGKAPNCIPLNYKQLDLFHAKTGRPIVFSNVQKDRSISSNEIMLLAVREFAYKLSDEFRYIIDNNTIHIYYNDYWNVYKHGADHYIIEVNDSWGKDKIEQAKKLRSECFYKDVNGRKTGREPIFYKVCIRSHSGNVPTYDDYECSAEKCNFTPNALMTEEEKRERREEISSLSFVIKK